MLQPRLFDAPQLDEAPRTVLDHDGVVTYDPYFIDPWTADELFTVLRTETPWKQETLQMYGREIPFPRLTAWYGDPGATYTYSGIKNEPLPWNPILKILRDRLESELRAKFNSVLLNFYRSGRDSLSWHADDEPELGSEPVIASVSLGAARRFLLRHRGTAETIEVPLEHGSLLVMSGPTQMHWKHQVPKDGKVDSGRINLTFRLINANRYDPAPVRSGRSKGARKARSSNGP
jgi:alkylated DNA repair dioxygenase AlkB